MIWFSRANLPLERHETPAGARLPYACHADDATIVLRDGMRAQMIHLAGMAFETADTEELNYRHNLREAMLRAIASPHFGLYHHILRSPVAANLPGTATDPFCAKVDRAWAERLASRQMFANDLFLTLVWRPLPGPMGLLDAAANLFRSKPQINSAAGQRELDAAVEAMLRSLAPYGARRLSAYGAPDMRHSEPVEFLSYLFNGVLRPVQLPRADLGHYIAQKRVSFGGDTLHLKGATRADQRYGAMLSIKDYPASTSPGLLDSVLRLPREMVITQSFGFVGRETAQTQMNLAIRRMRSADDAAVSLRSNLAQAKDDVAAGRSGFGEHHLTVQVRTAALDDLDSAVADVLAGFTDAGLIAVREDIAMEPSFWAQFPGNFKDIPRRSLISTGNFAALSSLHNFPTGQASGNHWGPAITVLETTSATPYHFNFHHGDLGNFTVIGPSGSGKTVVLTFLLAQAAKLNPRTVYFDKDRGAEIFVRATGGCYHVLRPGEASGFNPLALPDSPGNRAFLTEWVERLVSEPGAIASVAERESIASAVDASFDQPTHLRRLRYFRELLAGADRPAAGDLAHRLAAWVDGGERAWLFDNADDSVDLSVRNIGFDMTQILDDPICRTPAMLYLFHRVEERLDGSPAIIIVDEGWKALDDRVFVARIRDWQKTLRKRGGILGFATQNARDALDSAIGPAIIEQAATQIFMPNPKAQAADYCDGFGLSAHEFDLVRSLPAAAHCFLIKHGRDSVIARLDLTGLDDILTVLSGREASVRRLDSLRAVSGNDPRDWLEPLLAGASK